jgi:hypothetical protein
MLKISSSTANDRVIIHLDKYSKAILTVIACSLVLIVVNIYFSPKDANAYDTVQDVNLKTINGYSISGGYMPVDLQRIEGSTGKSLPVDIKSINSRNVYGDKIPVDIQSINGQFFIGSELPVKVK